MVGGPFDSSFAGAAWIFPRGTNANAPYQQQGPKLQGTGGVGPAEQGSSVAISADGNTVIVGGPFDNAGIGAAWVFTRSNGVWSQQGSKLVGGSVSGIAGMGTSVALSADGNTAAIGGPLDSSLTGAVWIFTRSGGVWTQQGGKLTGSDVAGASNFGSAVSLSGDGNTLIVGGPSDANNAGATWAFTRSGSSWSQQGSKLVGSGGVTAGQGTAVAVSGDGNTLLTGGPGDSNGGAWAFVRNGSAWTQQGAEFAGGPLNNSTTASLGDSNPGWVALSGDGNTALVGASAPGYNQNAYVFTRSGGVWTRQSNPLEIFFSGFLSKVPQRASVAISSDGATAALGGPDMQFGVGGALVFAAPPPPGVPSVGTVTPASGSGYSQTFTFTFSNTAGAAKLTVLNILINNVLDGRQACYMAYENVNTTIGGLDLVDNAGNAAGPYGQVFIFNTPSPNYHGAVQNAQCAITSAGSTVSTNGNTLTLTLAISFSPSFAGNKAIYLAARQGTANSGWQAMGTWNVPGPVTTGPSVTGMSPASSTGPTQTYTFMFSDTNGWQDIGVANVLVNHDLDGRQACYLAYTPAGANTGMLNLLVDNPANAGGPSTSMVLPGSGTLSNSQCTVSATGATVSGAGNTLTLTLPITFNHSFAGANIFYLAARNNTLNSGWQTVGTVSVP